MPLPTILPYSMPSNESIPMPKVNWQIDPASSVLLIHDMQNYFIKPFTANASPLNELIDNIRQLRIICQTLHIPIIYSAQPGGQQAIDRGLLTDFWGPGLPTDNNEENIIEELTPQQEDIVLTKWRYSAFQRTNLADILQQKKRSQLIICGIYAHIGCLMTACEAFMKDIQTFIVADAVADFSLEHHQFALNYARDRCAVTLPTQHVLNQLGI